MFRLFSPNHQSSLEVFSLSLELSDLKVQRTPDLSDLVIHYLVSYFLNMETITSKELSPPNKIKFLVPPISPRNVPEWVALDFQIIHNRGIVWI